MLILLTHKTQAATYQILIYNTESCDRSSYYILTPLFPFFYALVTIIIIIIIIIII